MRNFTCSVVVCHLLQSPKTCPPMRSYVLRIHSPWQLLGRLGQTLHHQVAHQKAASSQPQLLMWKLSVCVLRPIAYGSWGSKWVALHYKITYKCLRIWEEDRKRSRRGIRKEMGRKDQKDDNGEVRWSWGVRISDCVLTTQKWLSSITHVYELKFPGMSFFSMNLSQYLRVLFP